MRIWNPFKPHICEVSTGGYVVRALGLGGWAYLDKDQDLWWDTVAYIAKYCIFVQPVDAAERIVIYKKRKPFSKLYAY